MSDLTIFLFGLLATALAGGFAWISIHELRRMTKQSQTPERRPSSSPPANAISTRINTQIPQPVYVDR